MEEDSEVTGGSTDCIGSDLQFFVEKAEVVQLISRICCSTNKCEFGKSYETLNNILLRYLEQPQLIHPHIVELVAPMNTKLENILSFGVSVSCYSLCAAHQ